MLVTKIQVVRDIDKFILIEGVRLFEHPYKKHNYVKKTCNNLCTIIVYYNLM